MSRVIFDKEIEIEWQKHAKIMEYSKFYETNMLYEMQVVFSEAYALAVRKYSKDYTHFNKSRFYCLDDASTNSVHWGTWLKDRARDGG